MVWRALAFNFIGTMTSKNHVPFYATCSFLFRSGMLVDLRKSSETNKSREVYVRGS